MEKKTKDDEGGRELEKKGRKKESFWKILKMKMDLILCEWERERKWK